MIRLSLAFCLGVLSCVGLPSHVVVGQDPVSVMAPCEQRNPTEKGVLKTRPATTDNPAEGQGNNETKKGANLPCATKSDRIQIEFYGLQAFENSDVLKAFREHQVALSEDRMPTGQAIEQASRVLKDLLKNRGYMDANISGTAVTETKTVRFVVEEGVRYFIGALSFEGNQRISSEELGLNLRQCVTRYAEHTQLGYDRDVFEFCERTLLSFVRGRGYLQAKSSQPGIIASGKALNITLPIDEGPLYRLRNIRIDGAKAFTLDEVKSLLTIAKGDIADGEKIANWLFEDLRRVYGEKGFIQYMAEIQPIFSSDGDNPREGVVDLDVTIDEGKQFTFRSITFLGDPLQQNEMNALFLLRPGDFYNDQLFQESVTRVNNSGAFEPLDKDKDSTFSTNDEEATVAIVLTLHRKGKQMSP